MPLKGVQHCFTFVASHSLQHVKVCRLQKAAWLGPGLFQVLCELCHALPQESNQGCTHLALREDTWLTNEFSCPLQEAEARTNGGHKRGPEGHVRLDITG